MSTTGCPLCSLRRASVIAKHEHPTLGHLEAITAELAELQDLHTLLVNAAIDEGYSERVIGAAAGMTGPAISQRKRGRAA